MQLNKIYLAPMEGVCDPPMRKVLTKYGQYDACFSEFVRVNNEVISHKTLLREVPELNNEAQTEYGCPCRVQFLGDVPKPLALSAKKAVELGAKAIDLNFGCPSRFVHHGGAILLQEPDLLNAIVKEVRDALDDSIHLSVKMRLGVLSSSEMPQILEAFNIEGLNEITIHARTRKAMYNKELLEWEAIKRAHDYVDNINLVANGEIMSVKSSLLCYKTTHTLRQMIGRAVFATPNIPQVLRSINLELANKSEEEILSLPDEAIASVAPLPLEKVLTVVLDFAQELEAREYVSKSLLDRLKQFLGYAHKYDERLTNFFRVFCRVQSPLEAQHLLDAKIDAIIRNEPLEQEIKMAEALAQRMRQGTVDNN